MILLTDKTILDPDQVESEIDCPKCGAQRGNPCIGRRGPRESLHGQRWSAWSRVNSHKIAKVA